MCVLCSTITSKAKINIFLKDFLQSSGYFKATPFENFSKNINFIGAASLNLYWMTNKESLQAKKILSKKIL